MSHQIFIWNPLPHIISTDLQKLIFRYVDPYTYSFFTGQWERIPSFFAFRVAIEHNHLPLLEWLRDPGTAGGVAFWDNQLIPVAQEYHRNHLVHWLRERGCPESLEHRAEHKEGQHFVPHSDDFLDEICHSIQLPPIPVREVPPEEKEVYDSLDRMEEELLTALNAIETLGTSLNESLENTSTMTQNIADPFASSSD